MKIDRVVYVIRNKTNGKRYVGYTTRGIARRWDYHVRDSECGGQCYLQRAIRKYGAEAFTIRVLERCASGRELKRREVFWIAKLGTYRDGYNLTIGGDGTAGIKWRPAVRRKHTKAVRAMWKRAEVRRAHAAALASPEYKRNHAAAMANPACKARRSASAKKRFADSKNRTHIAAAVKRLWKNKQYRRRMTAKIRKGHANLAYRKRCAARNLGKKLSAKQRRHMCEAQRRRRNKEGPEVRHNTALAHHKANMRPEVHRKIVAALRKRGLREFAARCVSLYQQGLTLTEISMDWHVSRRPHLNKIRAALIGAGVWKGSGKGKL